jgi:uncharacterized repeat protein (TIGR04076 family)
MRLYDLRVHRRADRGRSVCGLEVGDYFEVTESSRIRIPEGKHFCMYALQAVLPLLPAKQRKLPSTRLARAGLSRLLPGPGRARGDADRADSRTVAPHRRPDVTDGASSDSGCRLTRPPGTTRRSHAPLRMPGFDVVTDVQRPLVSSRPYPALLEIAAATDTCPDRASPASTRSPSHPVEIAGQIATLDSASKGRAFLGLARRNLARGRSGSTSRIGDCDPREPGRLSAACSQATAPASRVRSSRFHRANGSSFPSCAHRCRARGTWRLDSPRLPVKKLRS